MTLALVCGLLVALGLTTYMSALNLALVSVSRSAIEHRLEETGRLARRGWILGHLDELAHAVALFRTLGRVTCFALVLVLFAGFGDDARVTAGALAATIATSVFLVWFFTSVVAVALSRHMPNAIVIASVPFLFLAHVVALPFLIIVKVIDEAVRRLSGADTREPDVADEDLLLTIEDSRKEGELDPLSASILENVVEFRSTTVSTVMTPRTNIIALECTDDLDRIRAFLADAGHSRVPVFEDSLDSIIGVLYVKDLVRYVGTGAPEFRLRPLLRQPIRVPESKPVRELLLEFQHAEVHLALVVDEYGGTSGLATIEDVLEEIVGEINDEHDVDVDESADLKPLGPGRWEVSGRCRVDELNALLDVDLPDDDDYDTVAGFLLKAFGRIPRTGETIEASHCRFEVASASATQIKSIHVTKLDGVDAAPPQSAAATADEHRFS